MELGEEKTLSRALIRCLIVAEGWEADTLATFRSRHVLSKDRGNLATRCRSAARLRIQGNR